MSLFFALCSLFFVLKFKHMKNRRIFIAVIVALLLSACSATYTDHPIILKAESLVNEHPDSAYNFLSSIEHPEKLSKADYAAWCLHYTQAQYKLYMDIHSDSLINIAVDYYKNSGLKTYSGLSYYMLGCVSELLHKYENAMLAYNMAERALEGTKDYNIQGLVAINSGYLYVQNENYAQANINFKKALDLFKLSGNKKYQVSTYLELSNMSLQLGCPFDSTMFYSNKALNLSKAINDSVLYYHILSTQGELLNRKNKETAIANLLAGFRHCADLRTRNASFLAYLYSEINQPDSAIYYLKIANEEKGDKESEIFNELAKAGVYENRKDFEQAYFAVEKAYLMQDTVFRKKLKDQLYKIDKQYDLSEKERENAELKITNRNVIIGIGFLIILVLVILIVLLRMNIHHKKKEAEIELKQQKTEFELKENELENRKKRELLSSKLQQRMEMTVRFNKLQQSFYEPEKQTGFIESITNQVILTKAEWENYIKEANSVFDNKIDYLREKHKELTDTDLMVIVLIALGIDISDSCVLLNMSKETMYIRRKRVKKRLGIEDDLEKWIKQNIV